MCAEGVYVEGSEEDGIGRRAAIFIGPEFGTVSRPDLVEAAREAADSGFDVLIACAFNYEAHTTEFESLGRVPVLKARMNADLHMADDLKNTGKGNLFVIFGEPDIDILDAGDEQIRVKVNGVDVFHPNTGEVRSDGPDGIACWFVDTDYNEEAFFVRQAYFLGANDPYRSLKTTLKPKSTPTHGRRSTATHPAHFPSPTQGALLSRSSTISATKCSRCFGLGSKQEFHTNIENHIGPPIEITDEMIQACRERGQFGALLFDLYRETGGVLTVTSAAYVGYPGNTIKLQRNQAICVGLLVRISKYMLSVVKLSSNIEHGETVQALNRCIIESIVNVRYLLLKDSETVYDRFVKNGLRAERELYDIIHENIESRTANNLP